MKGLANRDILIPPAGIVIGQRAIKRWHKKSKLNYIYFNN